MSDRPMLPIVRRCLERELEHKQRSLASLRTDIEDQQATLKQSRARFNELAGEVADLEAYLTQTTVAQVVIRADQAGDT